MSAPANSRTFIGEGRGSCPRSIPGTVFLVPQAEDLRLLFRRQRQARTAGGTIRSEAASGLLNGHGPGQVLPDIGDRADGGLVPLLWKQSFSGGW